MDENTQAKFDEKLKEILTASKKKGYAEYQEVIDTFAEFNLEEDQFDKIWEALDKNKIVLRIETIEDDDIPAYRDISHLTGAAPRISKVRHTSELI